MSDILPDAVSYSHSDELPDGATVLHECDRRHFGYYYPAETWREFWPAETVPAARQWLFDRMASQMRDVFDYGACWVQVAAFDLETDEELASESCGGFDDVAYGVQEVFKNCEHAAQAERAAQADYAGRL